MKRAKNDYFELLPLLLIILFLAFADLVKDHTTPVFQKTNAPTAVWDNPRIWVR